GVAYDFFTRSRDDFLRDHDSLPRAHGVLEKRFHQAVLDAVESDDGDTPARSEVSERSREPVLHRAELVVHCYPERLEGLRGRVDATFLVASGHAGFDGGYQFCSRSDALYSARH